MGKIVRLTLKQERQIIDYFERSHMAIEYPDNFENAAIIALFRACKGYCGKVGKLLSEHRRPYNDNGKAMEQERARYRDELLQRLDMLAVRYYWRL